MIIAIDGPAGAGKSTISARLADRLGVVRIDTGALYRAVALAATEAGLAPEDPALERFVADLDIDLRGGRVWVDGVDVSERLRTPEVSRGASRYAAVPAVRAGLLGLQRRLGRARDAILDGRDIGTVVFPDADVKIFLTASVDARARRRYDELRARGAAVDLDQVRREIESRDRADSERAEAPLRKADDAVEVDTTGLTIDQVVDRCAAVVRGERG